MSVVDSPAVETFLKHLDNGSPSNPPVAIFDCDGTIIKGDIGEAMFYHQMERFLLRVSPGNIWLDHPKREELNTLYSALASLPSDKRMHDRRFLSFVEMMLNWYFDQLKEGKIEKACSDIVRLLTGFTEDEVHKIARATFAEEQQRPIALRKIGKHVIPQGIRYINETVALLTELQKRRCDIWVVSGSNKWSVEAVFSELGVPSDRIIGIELQSLGNMFSTKVRTPVPVLQGKIEALKELSVTQPMLVVSDSIYDVPLFEYSAGQKVLVNSRMETSYTFFKQSGFVQDNSWAVIETPTLQE